MNEIERLKLLKNFDILDTGVEEIFDNFTKLAALICEVPICLISLVDEKRQWFKSKYGLEACETPRDISFCGHAIHDNKIFYVEDATTDFRFKNNPLVKGNPKISFYAGQPLTSNSGLNIGTLCVIDHIPRQLTNKQLEQLELLSKQVMYVIESRIENKIKDKTHSLLNKLADNLPGFIYIYELSKNGKMNFPYSSSYIEQIYEVSPTEARIDADLCFKRIHPDDLNNVVKTIEISARDLSVWRCDYRVILPSFGEKWVRGIANPEKALNGSILWHGYICDITEQKIQEEYLSQATKMATLGEMAAGIAHEINNPLAIIKTAAQQINTIINRNELEKEKLIDNFEKINKTIDRISKIIKGLKFFSSPATLDNEFALVPIQGIIEDTISLCEERFKVNNIDLIFKSKIEFKSLDIQCRAVEISQVLLNLLNNSFDAIEHLEIKWVEISIQDFENEVLITVQDSGSGISPALAKKLLQPFYTTKLAGKGTGLGLSISANIIDSHRGKFWIDTNSSNTKFCFRIPKIQKEYSLSKIS